MRVVPFRAEHLRAIAQQGTDSDWFAPEQLARLEGLRSYTGLVGDEVVGCAGVVEQWPGRFVAWAYFSPRAKRYWKSIHKAVKAFLFSLPARRIEMDVRYGFKDGLRWAVRLGFLVEAPRRVAYFADGSDAVTLALVKEG